MFKKVKRFENENIKMPVRATKHSAGYDMFVAKDIVVYPIADVVGSVPKSAKPEILDAVIEKYKTARPTLVSTGVKCYLEEGQYLKLVSRSSIPLKTWMICGNSEGIIDADYADNPQTDGEIFFEVMNLSNTPVLLQKGDKICQGIICRYETFDKEETPKEERKGGFGSTNE